ncbi:MAG: RluA family pseudouridine synthase [Deltaproteobacteria bacterium]|nr:RluA family pseudouridine synthase [Deltaproteobacteria bacterium]
MQDSSLFAVLYEDEDCFVLNKPSGIHSVSLPKDDKVTLASQLLKTHPPLAKASPKASDGGLLQRLDFETSGVILGAKSPEAWSKLHSALGAGQIEKSYLALVDGAFPQQLALDTWIGAPNRRAKKVKVFSEKPRQKDRALPASSRLSLVQYHASMDLSVIEVFAPTARRHQVRAHAAFSGHPLRGDSLYGSERELQTLSQNLALPESQAAPQFLLHAEKISFSHPRTGQRIKVQAARPELLEALYRLGKISAGGETSSTS